MRFLRWLKKTPLWLAIFPIAVAVVLWGATSSYVPLTFDPSLYEVEKAHAVDLQEIDPGQIEAEHEAESEEAAAAAVASASAALGQTGLTDGTYTGYAPCGVGNPDGWKPYYVVVTIQVKDGKVVSITDVSGSSTGRAGQSALSWDPSENQSYLDQALYSGWGVKSQMDSQLSSAGAVSGIDTVSGATYSSVAVYNAYMDAVAQAGGSASTAKEVDESPSKAKDDAGKTKKVKADDKVSAKKLADGTWTGYAVCGEGNDQDWKPYYVAVTIKVKNGKVATSFKVQGTSKAEKGKAKLNWDKAENGAYLNWAANGRVRSGVEYVGVVNQMKDALGAGKNPQSIDTVSGATYSSEAIFDAFYAALKKSAKAGGTTVKEPEKKPSDKPVNDPSDDDPDDSSGSSSEPGDGGGSGDSAGDDGGDAGETAIDGTYMGAALCKDGDDPTAYSPYYIVVKVTVRGGKITEIADVYGDTSGEIDPRYIYDSAENATYLKFAINGIGKRIKGMKAKIQERIDAGETVDDLDVVSSATWSSLSILEAYKNAVSKVEAAARANLDLTVGSLASQAVPRRAAALTISAQEDAADFYAVLHSDGTLVFQKDASDEVGAVNYPASLAGYPSESKIPWLAAADEILEVRFDESFAALKPQSTKYWFSGCSRMRSIDLANLDASESDSMRAMFKGCSSLERVEHLEDLDTSSSTYFGSMFNGCSSLTSLDVSHFNAGKVEVLCFMFNGCSSLKTLKFAGEGWNSPELKLMVHVWEGCSSLESLDLTGLDTSHVTSMTHDFNGCTSLKSLNLSTVDTSSLGNMANMFDGCSALETVVLGPRFSFCGKNGTEGDRKVDLPTGNWKSAATGMVYANSNVPLLKADTYTLTNEPISEPAVEPVDPVEPIDISKAKITLKKASASYTGKTQKGVVKSVSLDGKPFKAGIDYRIARVASGKNVGSYAVVIEGIGAYKGSAATSFKITKAAAKATQSVKSKTYKASTLKKGAKSFTAIKLVTDGKATWKVIKNTAKKRITFKAGKVTVKKGTPAGVYRVKVKVSAKAGKNRTALAGKSFTIKVVVK